MAGLACGETSPLAWRFLAASVDYFMTIEDDQAIAAMRRLAAGSAHAVLEVPSNTLTFNFYADCLDCSINAPEGAPAAVLVLENYVPGEALSMANFAEHFVSFSYAGSNIVAGFSLTKATYDWGWGPEVGVDFTVYRPEGAESRVTSVSYFSGALGVEDVVLLESHQHDLLHGDVILMCSDGLSDMLTDPEIAGVLAAYPHSLPEMGEALVAAANEAGGRDNIAVVLVRAQGDADPAPRSWWPFKRLGG